MLSYKVKDLYNKIFKTLKEKIKKISQVQKSSHDYRLTGAMISLYKSIYRFTIISINISRNFTIIKKTLISNVNSSNLSKPKLFCLSKLLIESYQPSLSYAIETTSEQYLLSS